jgi:CHAT domain-containing protein
VLAHLPGGAPGRLASVLHLACHAWLEDPPTSSYLDLAGPLPVRRMLDQAAGRPADGPAGLVVLTACDSAVSARDRDESLTLATSFLAAGAAAVVATLWPVDDRRAAVLAYVLHDRLQAGRSPEEALRSAQCWLADPDRRPLDGMPTELADWAAAETDRALPGWAAYVCQGG